MRASKQAAQQGVKAQQRTEGAGQQAVGPTRRPTSVRGQSSSETENRPTSELAGKSSSEAETIRPRELALERELGRDTVAAQAGRDAGLQVGTQRGRSRRSGRSGRSAAGRNAVRQVGTQCGRSGRMAAGRDTVWQVGLSAGAMKIGRVTQRPAREGWCLAWRGREQHGEVAAQSREVNADRSGNPATSSKRSALSLERSCIVRRNRCPVQRGRELFQ